MGSFLEDLFSPAAGMSDLAGGDDAVFGQKPRVAPFIPVDTSEEAGKAVAANLENFDAITEFLNKVIPGFSDLLKQGLGASSDIISTGETLLKGEIPDDVKSEIMRSSAFRALEGGFGGTAMGKALTARDLGLTSLNLISTGANLIGAGGNSAQIWENAAEQGYSPFVISTPFQTSVTAGNNAGEQATKQFKFNVAASPDPAALAKFNTNVAIGQQLVGIAGGIVGGMGGAQGAQSGQVTPTQPTQWNYQPTTGSYVPTTTNSGYGWSDARLKRHLRFVRRTPLGYKVYRFVYKGFTRVWEGLLAQQVLRINPAAVWVDAEGFFRVCYSMTDVTFRRASI